MTKDETREAIKVMTAYIDGAEVEYAIRGRKLWNSCNNPLWGLDQFQYRIKKVPREWWLDVKSYNAYATKNSLTEDACNRVIKVREVIE